ncbi:MAG TPA: hypothetical protein VEZ12_22345 [Herpetosiphonaceae bacterium]|nr:hypothetical protein [Herpetosiphonaceae bacterium]
MTSPPATLPRRPLLHGWRGLVILSVGSIVLILAGIGAWWMSDRDLRRVEGEIAAAGMPMTWAAAGVATGERRNPDMERLRTLEGQLRPWPVWTREQIEPGSPLLTELHEWRAALSEADLTEVAQLIERIPIDRSIPPRGKWGWGINRRRPGHDLVATLGLSLAVAPVEDVRAGAHRLVRLLAIAPRLPDIYESDFHAALASAAVRHLAVRLPDLVGDAALARALLAIADRFEVEREQELVCQLLWLTECCRNPEVISSGFGPRLGLRLVRERLLRLKLAWILESRSCRPGFERHAVAARLMTAAIAKPPAFIDSNTDFSWGSWWGILPDPRRTEQDCTAATIRLKLLAAEISGQEWPIDPYSRSGERLRRIERDGVLIGGYSIGPDEHDAGGGRGDIALALYGPLKPPATTTLKRP